ncbi:MAG: hypothetical protein ACKE9I_06605 [Methylophagaceae bacterium]
MMTIIKSIDHSKSLVQQISAHKQLANNPELANLLNSLSAELDIIHLEASQLRKQNNSSQGVSNSKPEMKSGCYIFADQKGFFCPHCYDNIGHKVPTKRMNSKLRVCPSCRSSIS